MSFPDYQNQFLTNGQIEHVHTNQSYHPHFPQPSDSRVFNGFRTNDQCNPTNQISTNSRIEENGFSGFHTRNQAASNHQPARNVPDRLGYSMQGQLSTASNGDILQDQYGISQSQPKHPQFAVKTVRVSSYRNFPLGITQTPEELAEAGFFYSGKEDIVFCFFCGQGLKSWEPNDNVWTEHARWSPHCVHLLNCKGRDFVQMVQLAETDPEQPIPTVHNDTMPNGHDVPGSYRETVDGHTQTGIHQEVSSSTAPPNSDLLHTVAAESVVSNGYDKDQVLKAINVFKHTKGNSNFSATDLLSIIFGFEDGSIKYEEIVPNLPIRTPEQISAETGNKNPAKLEENRRPSKSVENKLLVKPVENNLPATSVPKAQTSRKTKEEIKSEAKSLMEENRQLKDQTICKICLEEVVSIVFLPCGHLCCCSQCAPALRKCPICRGFIKGTVKTYLT